MYGDESLLCYYDFELIDRVVDDEGQLIEDAKGSSKIS